MVVMAREIQVQEQNLQNNKFITGIKPQQLLNLMKKSMNFVSYLFDSGKSMCQETYYNMFGSLGCFVIILSLFTGFLKPHVYFIFTESFYSKKRAYQSLIKGTANQTISLVFDIRLWFIWLLSLQCFFKFQFLLFFNDS